MEFPCSCVLFQNNIDEWEYEDIVLNRVSTQFAVTQGLSLKNSAFPYLETKISYSKVEMNPINFSDTFNGPSSTLNPPSLLKH